MKRLAMFIVMIFMTCPAFSATVFYNAQTETDLPSSGELVTVDGGTVVFVNDGDENYTQFVTDDSNAQKAFYKFNMDSQYNLTDGFIVKFTARVVADNADNNYDRGAITFHASTSDDLGLLFRLQEDAIILNGEGSAGIINSATLDTTEFVDYELIMQGTSYSFFADDVEIMTGSLVTYGSPQHYIRVGDPTTGGGGISDFTYLEVRSLTEPETVVPEPMSIVLLSVALMARLHKRIIK